MAAVQVLWLIPVLSTVCALIAFGVGYAVAVKEGDEDAWFSYISDGGANPPESCIFSQFLNLAALFMGLSMYLRHRQYTVFFEHHHVVHLGWKRTVSAVLMWIGFFASLGMSVVANFQEFNVPIAHGLGAWAAFFGGLIYCWGQIFLAYLMSPRMTPFLLNHFRVLLALLATVSLTLHMLTTQSTPFVKEVNGVKPTMGPLPRHVVKLDPNSPFYTNHLIACISEWALALAFEVFVLSFAWELYEFEMHPPRLRLKNSEAMAAFANDIPQITPAKSAFGTFNNLTMPNGSGTAATGRIPRIRPAATGDFFTANPSLTSHRDESPWGTVRTFRNGDLN